MKKPLQPYEKAARVIRLMGWLSLLGSAAIMTAILLPPLSAGTAIPGEFIFLGAFSIVIPVFLFATARGIFRKKEWARIAGMVYGVISLFGIPIGTIIGGYVIWQLQKGWDDAPGSASGATAIE